MKVKLLNQYCGPRGSFAPGSVIEFPDDEAAGLIEGGYAEAADEPRTASATEGTEDIELEPQPPLDKPKDKGKGKGKK